MGRIGNFIGGVITGFVLYFAASHYHVVKSNDGVFVVPKVSQNLDDIYVDIRKFGLGDWQEHRMLAAALLNSEHRSVLEDSSLTGFRKTMISVMNDLLGTS